MAIKGVKKVEDKDKSIQQIITELSALVPRVFEVEKNIESLSELEHHLNNLTPEERLKLDKRDRKQKEKQQEKIMRTIIYLMLVFQPIITAIIGAL